MKKCAIICNDEIKTTDLLENKIKKIIFDLITKKSVKIFLFSERSELANICYKYIDEFKKTHLDLKTIYITTNTQSLKKSDLDYLYTFYDEIYHENCTNTTKFNKSLINKDDFCLLYYNPVFNTDNNCLFAYVYIIKNNKHIINLF